MQRALARRPSLVIVRASAPAPQRPQQPSGTPLRMSPVALAVEGPGSGRRRFPEPFEASPPSAAAAAAAAAPSAAAEVTAAESTKEPHPCVSTKDYYSTFQRIAGPPLDPARVAALGPPLSATAVAEVAGGPLSGRRVRPAPLEEVGRDGGPPPPRVPAAADREESSEALLREVRSRHGGC